MNLGDGDRQNKMHCKWTKILINFSPLRQNSLSGYYYLVVCGACVFSPRSSRISLGGRQWRGSRWLRVMATTANSYTQRKWERRDDLFISFFITHSHPAFIIQSYIAGAILHDNSTRPLHLTQKLNPTSKKSKCFFMHFFWPGSCNYKAFTRSKYFWWTPTSCFFMCLFVCCFLLLFFFVIVGITSGQNHSR